MGSLSWNPSPSSPTPSAPPELPDINPAKRDFSSRRSGRVCGLRGDRVLHATARERWRVGVARCLPRSGIVGRGWTMSLRVDCVPTGSSGRRRIAAGEAFRRCMTVEGSRTKVPFLLSNRVDQRHCLECLMKRTHSALVNDFCDGRRKATDLVPPDILMLKCLPFRSSYGFHSRRTTLFCAGGLLSSHVQSRSGPSMFENPVKVLDGDVAYMS